ncbi:MAG: hypothetical protein JW782_07500 [Candidatus Saganbacteria bacterium]|nr:hypothetical protein [Candidatus Saganbacteria bacterium]
MALLQLFLTLGFAYIIWVLASKEALPLKIIGQAAAVAIIIFALLAAVLPGGSLSQARGHQMTKRSTTRSLDKQSKRSKFSRPSGKTGEKPERTPLEQTVPDN